MNEEPLFIIAWLNTTNARKGRGTRQFPRVEAESLADELNKDYPEIEHQAVPVNGVVVRLPIE
jgi:hypothetical protein